MCVGTRKSRFWRFFTNGRSGARREFPGRRPENLSARHASTTLEGKFIGSSVIYCEVCLCPTSHLWSNHMQLKGVGRFVESVGTHSLMLK